MVDINPELIEKAAKTLADWSQHEYRGDIETCIPRCVCGWTATEPYDVEGFDRHITGVVLATVADDLRAEGAAEALHAALYDLEVTQSSHDVAECAAPVPGEVGRQDAIDEWVSICEEPVEWMRKFAQRYAHEAPSDAYIREVEEEARAEGAARALRDYADQLDQEAAEYAARLRVTHVLCRHCHLRYGERDQYPCVIAGTAHHYDEDELAEAAQVHVETTHDGDYARAHAIRIEARDV